MEAIENLLTRRSIRSYKPDAVPDELLDRVIEAGLYAPSTVGEQKVIILKVTNRELRDKLSKMNAAVFGWNNDPFYGAPDVLVVLADKNMPTHVYDGSVCMENMMLAAHALGLGTCWIHRAKEMFETDEGKEILNSLGVEGDYEGVANCIIGYPNGNEPVPAPRKSGRVYEAK